MPLLDRDHIGQQEALAEMYFNGNTNVLWKCFDQACATQNIDITEIEERWLRFETAIFDGRWDEARGELRFSAP
jgi:hypothetical protein